MAYKAYQPNKPAFRKVKKQRGANLDNISKEMLTSKDHKPWNSIYDKEICQSGIQLPGPGGPKIANHNQKASGAGP